MLTFYKIVSSTLLIFFILGVNLAEGQPQQTKNWLFAYHTEEKVDKFVGVMVNNDTCTAIAEALNQWASVPPVTPLKFHCEQEPVKA
jgi:hypothetical protein